MTDFCVKKNGTKFALLRYGARVLTGLNKKRIKIRGFSAEGTLAKR